MTIDINDLTQRVLAIRRGELPATAVTDEELREALAQQRARFAAGATRTAPKKSAKAPTAFNFDFQLGEAAATTPTDPNSGSLF